VALIRLPLRCSAVPNSRQKRPGPSSPPAWRATALYRPGWRTRRSRTSPAVGAGWATL